MWGVVMDERLISMALRIMLAHSSFMDCDGCTSSTGSLKCTLCLIPPPPPPSRFSCKPTQIGAYYRPPSDRTPDTVDDLNTVMENLDPDCPTILGGDFNAGDIIWESNTVAPNSDRKPLCERLIEVLETHHLEQIQREPTREQAVLDLYCTNHPGLVKSNNTAPGISDHNIIIVDSSIRAQQPKKPKRTIKQWSKVDWEAVKEESSKFRMTSLATTTRDLLRVTTKPSANMWMTLSPVMYQRNRATQGIRSPGWRQN